MWHVREVLAMRYAIAAMGVKSTELTWGQANYSVHSRYTLSLKDALALLPTFSWVPHGRGTSRRLAYLILME
jgi:hypothetical protein